jgi:hypothetical protein
LASKQDPERCRQEALPEVTTLERALSQGARQPHDAFRKLRFGFVPSVERLLSGFLLSAAPGSSFD